MSFAALPIFFWNHRRFAKRIWRLSHEVQAQTAGLYAILSERISAIRTIRCFGSEARELSEFSPHLDRQTERGKQSLRATSLQSLAAVLIGGLATALLVCLAAVLVERGSLTTGQAVAFVAYLGLLYQPLVRLTQFYGGIAATLAAVDRITELLDEPEPAPCHNERLPRHVRGELRLQNVSFRYRSKSPLVLQGINLRIRSGMTVGLYGASGPGKTLCSRCCRAFTTCPQTAAASSSMAVTSRRCMLPSCAALACSCHSKRVFLKEPFDSI